MLTQRCTQENCTGEIEEGYCNFCGHAAEKRNGHSAQAAGRNGSNQNAFSRNGALSRSVVTGTGSSPISRASRGSRQGRRTSSRTSRRQLGAGLITLPELPSTDPEKTCLLEPKIPEHKRFCSNCDAPLKRDFGFCGKCGQKFSFLPSLKAGDLVASQYEVKGALAFGGLGWIYLAFDRILSRYVVLKGLLNVHDASSAAAAVAERQFLASIKHPNIVGIYNFVQHGNEGFIVMEYVGGKTLKQLRQERGPLPPAEAVAYIHRILSAFSYLHSCSLVYCDFKPENVMLERDDVKLIDMGGVRRIDDTQGDIYSTAGYSAPEASQGPTPRSDLYAIGRTLAVLVADFRGLTTDYRYSLPAPADIPIFAEQESLYRALLKATAANPDDRFDSADEMAEQLLGVLREIVALSSNETKPAASRFFAGDPLAMEIGEDCKPVMPDARYVPLPLIDTSDPGARAVSTAIGIPVVASRMSAMKHAADQNPGSREAKLRLAATYGDAGLYDAADKLWEELATEDPWDWRVLWLRGRMRLGIGDAADAKRDFDQVYFDLPGELAPKLALAFASERSGDFNLAARMYNLVSRVDENYPSASFGAARCAVASKQSPSAIESLSRVPRNSCVYVRARVQTVEVLIANGRIGITSEDLLRAAAITESLPLDMFRKGEMTSLVLRTALELLRRKQLKSGKGMTLFGCRLRARDLQLKLERTLRAMAQLATGEQRIQLVDAANAARPVTLF